MGLSLPTGGIMKFLKVAAGVLLSSLIALGANASTFDFTVTIKKSEFDKYLKENGKNLIDIHGVDFGNSTVTVQPDSKLFSYLTKNKIDFLKTEKKSSLLGLEGYTKPDQVIAKLNAIAETYPNLTRIIDVAMTTEGRSIKGIEISDDFSADKPVISFNGMHHARELMTVEVVLSIAEALTSEYESDEEIRSFLRDFKIVVIPQVNPDGNIIVHEKDNWWRKNARANSKGRIFGVDLNRNYPVGWNSCDGSSGRMGSDTYRGDEPSSEPETQGMIAFFENYRPIANISYHSYSELIIYPFGCNRQRNTATELFHKIGLDMKKVIVDDRGNTDTYRVGTAPALLYQADGTDLDTHWQNYGTLSYTIEVNNSRQGFQPSFDLWKDKTVLGQKEGWKQLIRSSRENAVKFIASDDFEYIIKNDQGESFAGKVGPKTFKASKNKLSYRVLLAGKYILEIYKDGELKKAQPFELSGNILDLGKI